jgi:hypothetical protein
LPFSVEFPVEDEAFLKEDQGSSHNNFELSSGQGSYDTGPDRLENHAIGVAAAERNKSIPNLGFGDPGLGFRVNQVRLTTVLV